MGLICGIYRSSLGDCSAGGISSKVNEVTVINAEGPFDPSKTAPAVELRVKDVGGEPYVYAVPVALDGKWAMAGGTFISTSDSRFSAAVSKLGKRDLMGYAVALHDRVEE